jgi:hypothetical protein
MSLIPSSIAQFLSRRKGPGVSTQASPTISAQELRTALMQQEIAERAREDSARLNANIARRLRNGAALGSDDYEFDFTTNQVRERKASQSFSRACSR